MTVYWEYVFAENFLLDLLLVLLSLACARSKPHAPHVCVAAAVGGAEAVVFPLLVLPLWCAYAVKIAGGILIAVLAVRKGTFKTYLIAVCSFFFFTFALGGLLVAAYSFFGIEYAEGQGFAVERAPVGLVLAGAGLFLFGGVRFLKFLFRRMREQNNLYPCFLTSGERSVRWTGYSDSGNLLSYCGNPVSVISPAAVFALFGAHPREAGRMTVNTVNGGRDSPVFVCESLEMSGEKGAYPFRNVYLTVGDVHSKEFQIILHSALTEEYNEHFYGVKKLARKAAGRRRSGKLSLRERGASAAAFGRGRGGDAEKAGGGRGDGGGKGEADRA